MNDTPTIETPKEAQSPEVQKITQNAVQVAESLGEYEIQTAEELNNSAGILRDIKAAQKEVEAQRTAITGPLNASLRQVNAFFKQFSDRLGTAERNVKKAIGGYQAEQDRIRREEARKAQEKKKREEAKLRKQAEEAEAAGREERAQTLNERADAKTTEATVSEAPKVEGVSYVTVYDFEITDPSKIPDKYKIIDEKKIRQVVKALKEDAEIPGVRVIKSKSVRARAS